MRTQACQYICPSLHLCARISQRYDMPPSPPTSGRPPQPANPIFEPEKCKAYIVYSIGEAFSSCRYSQTVYDVCACVRTRACIRVRLRAWVCAISNLSRLHVRVHMLTKSLSHPPMRLSDSLSPPLSRFLPFFPAPALSTARRTPCICLCCILCVVAIIAILAGIQMSGMAPLLLPFMPAGRR